MPRETGDRTIFMNSTLVAKIPKSKLEEIRLSVLKNNKVDVRIYRFMQAENEMLPTRKGIWLSFRDIPGIISALEKLASGAVKEINIEIQNTKKLQVRVYTLEYREKPLVHIRTFYARDNEFSPGKGVSFQIGLAKDMAEALRQAEKLKE